jgi:hypothetical protein
VRARGWIKRVGGIASLAAALWLCGGCEPYGVEAPAGADTVAVTLLRPDAPRDVAAKLYLYRTTARQTGERIGIGRRFAIGSNRQVRAVLQMEGLTAGEPLLLHIVWINPDGKKAFAKEVRVRPEDWTRRVAVEEQAGQPRLTLDPQGGRLELESRYGIDPIRLEEEMHKPEESRTFRTGHWGVKVYLYRKLILGTDFELVTEE